MDAANRGGVAGIYGALFRAAWRDPQLWAETAAAVEILQAAPLTEREWARWLEPWRSVPSPSGDKARAWADLLAQPGPQTWLAATGKPWGRLAASLLADDQPLPPALAALRDSLQLRSTPHVDIAEGAFNSLLALGGQGNWHAQALLEDFEERYHSAYIDRRGSLRIFREHARLVAEAQVKWRTEGVGFCRRDSDAKWRAMGRALEHGSIRFSTVALEEGAAAGSEAARIALYRVKARQSANDIPK
jgi:hypothetical protein